MLARTCLWLLGCSTLFPIVASVMDASALPAWVGVTDVVLAATVVAFALRLAVVTAAPSTLTEWRDSMRVARSAVAPIPLLLALFFLAGARVRWPVLVIGLAWRAWLLVFLAPQLAVALQARRERPLESRHDG